MVTHVLPPEWSKRIADDTMAPSAMLRWCSPLRLRALLGSIPVRWEAATMASDTVEVLHERV